MLGTAFLVFCSERLVLFAADETIVVGVQLGNGHAAAIVERTVVLLTLLAVFTALFAVLLALRVHGGDLLAAELAITVFVGAGEHLVHVGALVLSGLVLSGLVLARLLWGMLGRAFSGWLLVVVSVGQRAHGQKKCCKKNAVHGDPGVEGAFTVGRCTIAGKLWGHTSSTGVHKAVLKPIPGERSGVLLRGGHAPRRFGTGSMSGRGRPAHLGAWADVHDLARHKDHLVRSMGAMQLQHLLMVFFQKRPGLIGGLDG